MEQFPNYHETCTLRWFTHFSSRSAGCKFYIWSSMPNYKLQMHIYTPNSIFNVPVSRTTTPLTRIRPFHWNSMKSRLVGAARETSKFHNSLLLTNSRRCYMAEILPIRRKTLSNQLINRIKSN